jgi:hypothetical protein
MQQHAMAGWTPLGVAGFAFSFVAPVRRPYKFNLDSGGKNIKNKSISVK